MMNQQRKISSDNGQQPFVPDWEPAQCHLCGTHQQAEPVLLAGRPLTEGQFGYEVHPVLCRCGLVFLNPRWTAATFNEFYRSYYDDLYRLEIKPDYGVEGVVRHMREVWERVNRQPVDKSRIKHILDVGCGSGYGLRYLREQLPDASIYGIEASPECCRVLEKEVGARLVGQDVNGPWLQSNRGKFDFIVMRHVVEHFLDPAAILAKLKEVLSPQGFMYIAVPDMMHPRIHLRDYDKWWEYYFRAVHPYYYSRQTLFSTFEMAGLYPHAWGEENEELWCLVKEAPFDWQKNEHIYADQLQVLRRYLP